MKEYQRDNIFAGLVIMLMIALVATVIVAVIQIVGWMM